MRIPQTPWFSGLFSQCFCHTPRTNSWTVVIFCVMLPLNTARVVSTAESSILRVQLVLLKFCPDDVSSTCYIFVDLMYPAPESSSLNFCGGLDTVPAFSPPTQKTDLAKNMGKWKHHFSLTLFVSFPHPFSSVACQGLSSP